MNTIEDVARRTDVPVIVADHNGNITDINPSFTEIFGWSRTEILGRPLTVIIPKDLRDAHHLGFSRFLSTGKPTLLNQALKLKAIKKDGREFDAEHYIAAEHDGKHWTFAATIRPLKKD
ncbi:MAG: PAS domain S-box protein [Elusimicrobia bacterium]|nr:PAS domain S-box protein [Elusimicrobiota bacterium]